MKPPPIRHQSESSQISQSQGFFSKLLGLACSEEGVGEDDELTHEGGEGKVCGLTGFDELSVFGLQIGLKRAATGARPARLAACLASRVPSSGISISKAKAVIRETPGMLVRMAKRLASSASASMKARMAASMAAI